MDKDALRAALAALLRRRFGEILNTYSQHWITATAELIIQLFERYYTLTPKDKGGE